MQDGQGFSEAALAKLAELESYFRDGAVRHDPAARPVLVPESEMQRAAPVRDTDGRLRPHYHGHRERLRTRFMEGGAEAVPDYELVELVLFNGIPRIDVKPLAKRLLEIFGDFNGVMTAPEERLMEVQGMTPLACVQFRLAAAAAARMAKAKVIRKCVVSSWDNLMEYCKTVMAHRDTEQFRLLFLDRKNVLIADEAQAEGTVNHVPVYPREVVRRALTLNASAIILVHNHPSGDPTPSQADIEMTSRIEDALKSVEIVLHDHVIIGKEHDTSFRSLGLI